MSTPRTPWNHQCMSCILVSRIATQILVRYCQVIPDIIIGQNSSLLYTVYTMYIMNISTDLMDCAMHADKQMMLTKTPTQGMEWRHQVFLMCFIMCNSLCVWQTALSPAQRIHVKAQQARQWAISVQKKTPASEQHVLAGHYENNVHLE